MNSEWRNFSANSLLIPEVWGSRCGVACGPLHEYNALMAREPFPDAKKALESERTRTDDDRALALALALDCRGSESLQKRLIQFKQFPPHPPLPVSVCPSFLAIRPQGRVGFARSRHRCNEPTHPSSCDVCVRPYVRRAFSSFSKL